MKTAYIFDFDNVLFDTQKFKLFLEKESCTITGISAEQYNKAYKDSRDKVQGFFHYDELVGLIKTYTTLTEEQKMNLYTLFFDSDFLSFLFDPSHAMIRELGTDQVYIVSRGAPHEFQENKVKKALKTSGIQDSHIHISSEDKNGIYRTLGEQLLKEEYSSLIFLNDKISEIEGALRLFPDCSQGIMFRYGEYGEGEVIENPNIRCVDTFDQLSNEVRALGQQNPDMPQISRA